MRYLLLSSWLLIFMSCTTTHKSTLFPDADISSLVKFKPDFSLALYNANIEVVGNHLGGLLLIKKMPDSSIRFVFSNEMGYSFFDFEFAQSGLFKVHSIIKKLNKKLVIKTLQHDFELVLMNQLNLLHASVRKENEHMIFTFPQAKGFNNYIMNKEGTELELMRRTSNKKTLVEAIMKNYTDGIPDTMGISHKTFEFNIGLKRIER